MLISFEGIFYYGSDDMPYTIQSTIRLYLIDKGIIDTRDFEDEEFEKGEKNEED